MAFLEEKMKLTEENADYMDCRPPKQEPVDLNQVPGHMRAGVAERRAAKAKAEASRQGASGQPLI
jgi:hypothetical protein